ncbi:MAG: asparagine synthase (glutamine-hydrolyzing), partial [Planctomycetes bacterium]|nr:asparagine synthase (glutamine-hydrolyzing) [Planctomycetota bacterium]
MCGIFGIVHVDGRPVDLSTVGRAVTRLKHRGPDDEGYLLADTRSGRAVACAGADTVASLGLPRLESVAPGGFDAALGFRRLSILDLSPGGHQPMATPDGRCHIVFNGEIYNYVELRAELEGLGRTFRTRSDTEVLLAACAEWGPAALPRLVGMFAFALLDLKCRTLLLARDCFGIKPLVYIAGPERFAFASEIKALLELPGVPRRAAARPLYDYLRFGVACRGEETFLADVRNLPAAHYLEVRLDRPADARPVRYWQPDLSARADLSFDEAAAGLRTRFLDNVRLHLRSDVPVGSALSGGIDSSAIVMAMRQIEGRDLRLHTFSYIAADPALTEEPWVDRIVAAAGATSHKTQPDPRNLVEDLDHLIDVQEEPFGSTSIYAQHRVFRLAREAGIQVVLDGQGA